jgi:phosphoglycolate phosphatase
MQRDIRAVIVDLDGTMVDTLGDFEEALNRTLADLDLPPVTRTLIEHTVGKGSEHLIRSVLAHQLALPEVTGLSNVCQARNVDTLYVPAWQRYQDIYRRINGQFSSVYPGVVEGLVALQAAGLKMACLTNKPLAFAQALLRVKALEGHFGWVFGGDSFERKKPDPMPLLRPGESFQYTSGTRLGTRTGSMRGSFFCVAEDGERFEAEVPEFALVADGSGGRGGEAAPRVLH